MALYFPLLLWICLSKNAPLLISRDYMWETVDSWAQSSILINLYILLFMEKIIHFPQFKNVTI